MFDPEVTGLRRTRLLDEILTNAQSARYARRERVAKGDVPRFSVHAPNEQGRLPLVIAEAQSMKNPIVRQKTTRLTNKWDVTKTVYVSNLPYRLANEELIQLFAKTGKIEKIFLPLNGKGPFIKGYAFVTFSTIEEAMSAIKSHNSTQFASREIHVRKYNAD